MSANTTDELNQPLSEINVTPLVDVMLVLLVIFILLAPMITNALQIDLPQTSAKPLMEPNVVDVTVLPGGNTLLDKQPVSRVQLISKLNTRINEDPELVVRLNADKDTHYQTLSEVLSQLQQAGLKRLAFSMKPS